MVASVMSLPGSARFFPTSFPATIRSAGLETFERFLEVGRGGLTRDTGAVPVDWSEAEADAASFIAVVPPEPITSDILRLRRAAGLDTAVFPHVTVKAQPNLGSPGLWRPAVRDALAAIAPFDVTLGDVDWFGDGIVFLSVSDEVVRLHRVVLDAIEAVVQGNRFEYEGDTYVPHLTLGAAFVGETREQLRQLAEAACGRQWPSFRVHEVVEFRRERRDEGYMPVSTYALRAV